MNSQLEFRVFRVSWILEIIWIETFKIESKNNLSMKFKVALFTFFTSFILFISLALFIFFVVFNMSSQILFISSFISLVIFATSLAITISKKIYMTMNNLFVIFFERFKFLDLIRHQRNKFSLYHWQFNTRTLFISQQTRIIFYFLFVTSKKSKKLNSNR